MKSLQKKKDRLKKTVAELELDKLILRESLVFFRATGLTQVQQRLAVVHTGQKLNTSERRTCKVLDVARSTLNRKVVQHDYGASRLAMLRLAKEYSRHGYRKITQLLQIDACMVNH